MKYSLNISFVNMLKVLIPCLIMFSSCQTSTEEKVAEENPQSVSEIKASADSLLNVWHKAASDANYEAYFGAMDSSSIFIGTDVTENWSKKEFEDFSKPHFDKGKAWDFKVLERNMFLSQNAEIIWFDEVLDTWMGPCRGSGVLEKSDGKWKIKHYVLSMTVPNDDVDEIIELKSENDSIYLSRFK